jgi:hypothetical protein
MRQLTITAVLGALALGPATAGAAPVAVSPRTVEASPASLAFDAAGDGLASWRGLSGTADSSRPFHALAARTPAGAWEAPSTLPRSVISADVALFGAGRIALVTEREQPAGKARTRSLIALQLGTAVPLRLGPPRILDRGPVRHVGYDGPRPTRFSPLVGVSDIGTVVVAWERSSPRSRSGIWIATNGDHVRRIAPHGGSPSLAIAPDGSGLLAWRRGSRVLARVRTAAGLWGPIDVVANVGRYTELAPTSIAGADGRFAVALTAITRSGGGVHWRSSLHVRNGGWTATRLEDRTFVPTGATSYVTDNLRTLVTMTPDGQFHAAWPGLFGTKAAVDDVAAGPCCRWAATWFDGSPNLTEFGAGDPKLTSGFATEPSLAGSRVAYDPLTGKPVVIWSQGTAAAGFQIVAGP